MSVWFLLCALCFLVVIPLHFRSVEHTSLREKYGKRKGVEIGRIYGVISGTIVSVILVGIWVSPQPSFTTPILSELVILIAGFSIPFLHLLIGLPLTAAGAWFGLAGLRSTGFEVAETHCSPERIVTTGIYSIVRHPQYLGWILAHIGVSLLLSASYSMLFTPFLLGFVYLISRKEEDELIKEFGEEYGEYQEKVPMLIPGWK